METTSDAYDTESELKMDIYREQIEKISAEIQLLVQHCREERDQLPRGRLNRYRKNERLVRCYGS